MKNLQRDLKEEHLDRAALLEGILTEQDERLDGRAPYRGTSRDGSPGKNQVKFEKLGLFQDMIKFVIAIGQKVVLLDCSLGTFCYWCAPLGLCGII